MEDIPENIGETAENGNNSDGISLFVLLEMLRRGNDGYTVITNSIEVVSSGVERAEGESITYGNAIEINADNISELGLENDIVTYGMDENGNFHTQDAFDLPLDFDEVNPDQFLATTGARVGTGGDGFHSWSSQGDGTYEVSGHEDTSFMLQRVEMDGITHGYFLSDGEGGAGFYIGPDAIDYEGLPEDMRAELAKPEEQPEAEADLALKPQDPAADAGLDNQAEFDGFKPTSPNMMG